MEVCKWCRTWPWHCHCWDPLAFLVMNNCRVSMLNWHKRTMEVWGGYIYCASKTTCSSVSFNYQWFSEALQMPSKSLLELITCPCSLHRRSFPLTFKRLPTPISRSWVYLLLFIAKLCVKGIKMGEELVIYGISMYGLGLCLVFLGFSPVS